MMFLLFLAFSCSLNQALNIKMSQQASKSVLIIGGTRFSGLYLWKELDERGHKVTLLNRGKTAPQKLPSENEEQFENRMKRASFLTGDRTNTNDLEQLRSQTFDVIYDLNGREVGDTAPVVDMFKGRLEHYVYMSSAGVYKKSAIMPHHEDDAEDPSSRHKGKLETETYLRDSGIPFTSIRPTYIYGPLNYNPLEEYFFSRLSEKRRICIPGHGQHVTGLGHVADLAVAMAQVMGREHTKGQIYNIQDIRSVTFQSLVELCAKAMGKDAPEVDIKFYDQSMFDFGGKKAFPMREQHFFCSVDKAVRDLDWTPKFSILDGLKDSYLHDFKLKKASGSLKNDFSCDDMILNDDRVAVLTYDGMAADDLR